MITFQLVLSRISIRSDQAAERYGVLVEGWRGLFAQALDDPRFGSPSVITDTIHAAYEIAHAFLKREGEHVDEACDELVSDALRLTGSELSTPDALEASEAIDDHSDAIGRYIQSELTIQIERDIAFLKQALVRTQLQVAISARATGLPMRAALMAQRTQNTHELQFFFHDRRNQKWSSRKFVRALWRHNLIALYNETVLMTLADFGEEFARIRHIDARADGQRPKVAIEADGQTPTYFEVRNEIFHPNADALLARWREDEVWIEAA